MSPYFKTEPVRTQVHLEGNRLVLTCMAEGSWPLEFKWLHNNRELPPLSSVCPIVPSVPLCTLTSTLSRTGQKGRGPISIRSSQLSSLVESGAKFTVSVERTVVGQGGLRN